PGLLGAPHVRDGAFRRRGGDLAAGLGAGARRTGRGSVFGLVRQTAPGLPGVAAAAGFGDAAGGLRAPERDRAAFGDGRAALAGGGEHRLERPARRGEAAAGVAADLSFRAAALLGGAGGAGLGGRV